MLGRIILLGLTSSCFYVGVESEGECPDIHGRIIAPGLHYVPGPDTCTLCICENGQPKWCKAVLCSPPQDCKSFRLGNTCCEFICLDDALSKHPDSVLDSHQDFGLRLIASGMAIVLFLSVLFFMVHRLRQRKLRGHQNRQMNEDQRSLASIGYIGGSLGYLGGGCDDAPVHFPSLWKPPGNYFPRGEAPPPYDEAVAQARAEAISINNMPGYHRSFPLNAATNMENLMRVESNHQSQQNRNQHISNPQSQVPDHSSVTQFHNSSGNARMPSTPFYLNSLSTNHGVGNSIADMRDRQVVVMGSNQARNFTAQHSITSSAGSNNFISTLKITSSLAAVTNRARVSNMREQNDCSRAGFLYNTAPQSSTGMALAGMDSITGSGGSNTQPRILPTSSIETARQHRTIPRMLSALEDQVNEPTNYMMLKQRSSLSTKAPREVTSFRTNEEVSRHSSSGSGSRLSSQDPQRQPADKMNDEIKLTNDCRVTSDSSARLSKENILRFGNDGNSHSKSSSSDMPRSMSEVSRQLAMEMARVESESKPTVDISKRPSTGSLGRLLERHPLLPMPAETTPCGCSYEPEPLAMMNDDPDDYHSECENCKSANGSRYYLDESEEGSELCETMTLHRRPLPEHAAEDLNQLPTSLTLPVKTKRSRCSPGARDAWFSSMPGTSSSEDD